MKRRQTLGSLSPSQMNLRSAQQPGRVKDTKNEPKSEMKNRRSIAPRDSLPKPASNDRRNSLYAKTLKQDTRPINDKGFQQQCIRKIVSYLVANGYEHPVTNKTLSLPSSKDFTNLAHFLLKKHDPNFKLDGKLEEDFPLALRIMGYPYTLSKSCLVTVGAPHTWPSVLAAVHWLVEQLMYSQMCGATIPDETEEIKELQAQEEIDAELYMYYLTGEDDKFQDLERMHQQDLEKEDMAAEKLVEQREKEKHRISSAYEQLLSRPDPYIQAVNDLRRRKLDCEKAKSELHDAKAELHARQQKLHADANGLVAKEQRLEAQKQANAELKALVDSQRYNKSDAQKILARRDEMRVNLEAIKLTETESDHRYKAIKNQVDNSTTHLVQLVAEYNRKVTDNFQERHQTGEPQKVELARVAHDLNDADILHPDFETRVWPQLENIYQEKAKAIQAIGMEVSELRGGLDRMQLQVDYSQRRAEALQHQVDKAKQERDDLHHKKTMQLADLHFQRATLEEQAKMSQQAIEKELKDAHDMVKQKQHELAEVSRECDEVLAVTTTEVCEEIQEAQAFYEGLCNSIAEGNARCREVRDQLTNRSSAVADLVEDTRSKIQQERKQLGL